MKCTKCGNESFLVDVIHPDLEVKIVDGQYVPANESAQEKMMIGAQYTNVRCAKCGTPIIEEVGSVNAGTGITVETIKEIVETALKNAVPEKKTRSTKSTRGTKKKKDQEVAQVEPIEENNLQPVQESVQPVETAPVNTTAPVENVAPHVEQGNVNVPPVQPINNQPDIATPIQDQANFNQAPANNQMSTIAQVQGIPQQDVPTVQGIPQQVTPVRGMPQQGIAPVQSMEQQVAQVQGQFVGQVGQTEYVPPVNGVNCQASPNDYYNPQMGQQMQGQGVNCAPPQNGMQRMF